VLFCFSGYFWLILVLFLFLSFGWSDFINKGRFERFMPFIDPFYIPRDRIGLEEEISCPELNAILRILGHDLNNTLQVASISLQSGRQAPFIGYELLQTLLGMQQLHIGNGTKYEDIDELVQNLISRRNIKSGSEVACYLPSAEPVDFFAKTYPGIVFLEVLHYIQNAEDQHIDLKVQRPVEVSLGTLKLRDLESGLGPNQHLYKPDTDLIRISVLDYGNGIKDEALPRIFELGYSGRKSTGIGLGLTDLSLHRLHGVSRVDTAIGVGSMFSLYFPRKRIVDTI